MESATLTTEMLAEQLAAPFYGRPELRENAPCAECGEPHAIGAECQTISSGIDAAYWWLTSIGA